MYINLMGSCCEFTNLIVKYCTYSKLKISRVVKLYHRYIHTRYIAIYLQAYIVCIIYGTCKIRVQPIMLLCCSTPKFYLICSTSNSRTRIAVSLLCYLFTYKFIINEPLHKADNFRKIVLLKCIYKQYQDRLYVYQVKSVLLEHNNHLL